MPGPRPDPTKPHSKYRDRPIVRELVNLPAAGCPDPVPPMPKGRRWTEPEQAMWADLWGSPQATQWDDAAAPVVAQYVLHTGAVLRGKAAAWQATEARHLGEQLGLSPTGLQRLGWKVAEPESAEPAEVVGLRAVDSP